MAAASTQRSALGASNVTKVWTFCHPMLVLYACSRTKGTAHHAHSRKPVPTTVTTHHSRRHDGPRITRATTTPANANSPVTR